MAAAGALFSIVGSIAGAAGSFMQADAMKKAESAREQQMLLEAQRKRRETLRQAISARATATSNAYSQGAGTTSALAGGLAQITNTAGRNIQGINQDANLGKQVFEANKDYADASGLIAIGNGISSIGGAISSSMDSLMKLGYA